DRRPYPWGAEDLELRDWYARLAALRASHESLRTGELTFLHADDAAGVLAFGRRTDDEAAITVLNLSEGLATVEVDVEGWLPAGTFLTDQLGGASLQVGADSVSIKLGPHGSAVLVTDPDQDLAPPEAPATLSAGAADGAVALTWDAVDDAARYTIW